VVDKHDKLSALEAKKRDGKRHQQTDLFTPRFFVSQVQENYFKKCVCKI